MTSAALAEKTGTHERYVREWLSSQAASGFVSYRRRDRHLLDERRAGGGVRRSKTARCTWPAASIPSARSIADEPRLAEAFKTGKGVGWGEYCNCLFCGVERFFRSGYKAHLVADWLPALDGVVAKLERGARVADVGCGHGVSTLLMAEAFPNSEFVGIDFHEASVAHATKHAGALRNVVLRPRGRRISRAPATTS